MRVVHIISALYQGGAESQLEKLIYHSHSHSHSQTEFVEHIVISLKNEKTPLMKRLRIHGVKVYCLNFSGGKTFVSFFQLRSLLKKLIVDQTVIQCWMYHANLFGLIASFSLGVTNKLVWNIRRTQIPTGFTGLIAKIGGLATHYISIQTVCCAYAAKESHINSGYNPKEMIVIPNGIDTDKFVPNPEVRAQKRKELGIRPESFTIIMIGRFSAVKGHIYLLEAVQTLFRQQSALKKEVNVLMIGRNVKSEKSLISLLSSPELLDNVIIEEEKEDIWNFIPCGDLLCMPSLSEGFPNVVAEAMSCGIPAIVTNVGDAAKIVGNENMVAIPLSSVSLAEVLQSFLNTSIDERQTVSNFSRKRVCSLYSISTAWNNYNRLYNTIIERAE